MNGWNFWGFQSGDGTLIPLAELRARLQSEAAEPLQAEEIADPNKDKPAKPPSKKGGPLKPLLDACLLAPGAVLFAVHQGQRHEATVDEQGVIHLADGSTHQSPSGAAVKITGRETNGWTFWRTTIDDKTVRLRELRDQAKTGAPS
jgi:Restriction Enzyme Adenine Methylase Associated/Protein of unknown function (DUF2924)